MDAPDNDLPLHGRGAASCPTRAVLNRVGDQWSLLVIFMLEEGALRFGALRKKIEGVSPRVLTQTLRALERDGLVTRTAFATIPPRVDYAITDLGLSLAAAMRPVSLWAERNEGRIDAARKLFDARDVAKVA
jgi:DNA-binding HxlR family transcriptional regulator